MVEQQLPELIQGGMGVGVSNWRLARAVSIAGQELEVPVLGVVSGTGIAAISTTRLQNGDEDQMRALEAFDPSYAAEVISTYRQGQRRRLPAKAEVLVNGSEAVKRKTEKLIVASAYGEVYLAKEGHNGEIGNNNLEKTQEVLLSTTLGAMMAGVDYMIVGAGIPHQIPAMLEDFASGRSASYRINVAGSKENHLMTLDPNEYVADGAKLKKPKFLPIVSSHVLAMRLADTIEIDGFIVEGPMAGGHNSPARGKQVDEYGQPIYGPKDEANLQKIIDLGKPFWLAGGYATPEALTRAKQIGAVGIQVGSAFALCNESGYLDGVKHTLRDKIAAGTLIVRTDSTASPSGFPFQVAQLENTLSDPTVIREPKACNIGHLATAYQKTDAEGGGIGYRCPAEKDYVKKGGKIEDTIGKKCLCNGLGAAAGYGGENEPMIVTLGKNTDFYDGIKKAEDGSYSAEDVVRYITSKQ